MIYQIDIDGKKTPMCAVPSSIYDHEKGVIVGKKFLGYDNGKLFFKEQNKTDNNYYVSLYALPVDGTQLYKIFTIPTAVFDESKTPEPAEILSIKAYDKWLIMRIGMYGGSARMFRGETVIMDKDNHSLNNSLSIV
ncbi:MAG: hypothetical protein FWD16_05160, partial [Clostridia bacterium]|nr:hypothetical protein [Clostridia bacterium]